MMRKAKWSALTMIELLVVLAIVGIIVMTALPNFMGAVEDAEDIEAQQQLRYLHMLQSTYYIKNRSYAETLEDLGFVQEKLTTDGGQARFQIEITAAGKREFVAVATNVEDNDGDGSVSTWTIDQEKNLTKVSSD